MPAVSGGSIGGEEGAVVRVCGVSWWGLGLLRWGALGRVGGGAGCGVKAWRGGLMGRGVELGVRGEGGWGVGCWRGEERVSVGFGGHWDGR